MEFSESPPSATPADLVAASVALTVKLILSIILSWRKMHGMSPFTFNLFLHNYCLSVVSVVLYRFP